jgi:hypothetical protein
MGAHSGFRTYRLMREFSVPRWRALLAAIRSALTGYSGKVQIPPRGRYGER